MGQPRMRRIILFEKKADVTSWQQLLRESNGVFSGRLRVQEQAGAHVLRIML